MVTTQCPVKTHATNAFRETNRYGTSSTRRTITLESITNTTANRIRRELQS